MAEEAKKETLGVIETSQGTIIIRFFPQDAPKTVENFISLAGQHFYDGLIFHRVVKRFVIQGGCPLGNGRRAKDSPFMLYNRVFTVRP